MLTSFLWIKVLIFTVFKISLFPDKIVSFDFSLRIALMNRLFNVQLRLVVSFCFIVMVMVVMVMMMVGLKMMMMMMMVGVKMIPITVVRPSKLHLLTPTMFALHERLREFSNFPNVSQLNSLWMI